MSPPPSPTPRSVQQGLCHPLDQRRGHGGVFRDLGRGGLRHLYRHRRGADVTTTVVDTSGPFSAFGLTTSLTPGARWRSWGRWTPGAGASLPATGAVPNVTTTIADSTGPLNTFGPSPAINAGGTVLFDAVLDAGGQGMFTGTGVVPNVITTIADTSGPFSNFASLYSINAGGAVAFFATLDAGTEGLFTGPDPVADKVIETGDPLFGDTVRHPRHRHSGAERCWTGRLLLRTGEWDPGYRSGESGAPAGGPRTCPRTQHPHILGIGLGALALAVRRKSEAERLASFRPGGRKGAVPNGGTGRMSAAGSV